jgi:Zn-dependent peptidase ImmA (M78 family)/predicted secreted protein
MSVQNDRIAVLKGMREALRLQRNLGLDKEPYRSQRIDVFDCISRVGATLMFQPMDKLLGAYLSEEGNAGIILNSQRPLGMQRFTAAHELGHFQLKHQSSADGESMLRRGPVASDFYSKDVPGQEREADAFASYFLLPDYLVKEQKALQKWTNSDISNPLTIYQASLRFGSSYKATVHALTRMKLVNGSSRKTLLAAKPADIKRHLLSDFPLETTKQMDVWHLTEKDEGAVIEAGRNDLFIFRLTENSGSGYIWTFDELQNAGFVILRDGRESADTTKIGSSTVRQVLTKAEHPSHTTLKLRECRPWDPGDSSRTFTFHYNTASSYEPGLYEQQREVLLSSQ